MSDLTKPHTEKETVKVGMSGWYVAVPALILAGLWFYIQLLQWKKHGDDYTLTVINIAVTLLLWTFAIVTIIRSFAISKTAVRQSKELGIEMMRLTSEIGDLKLASMKVTSQPAFGKLKIHSAIYGTGPDTDIDVTDKLQGMVQDGLAVSVANDLAPRDPHFGVVKQLTVEYSYGNPSRSRVTRPEGSRLVLPEDTWTRDELAKWQDLSVKDCDPQVYAEFCDDRGMTPNKESEAYITLINRGGSDALNVCIDPIRLKTHIFNFPRLAYLIARGRAKHRYPDVTTSENKTPHHTDVFSHLASEFLSLGDWLSIPELVLPLTVNYQDAARNLYEARCELVFNPAAHARVRTQGQDGNTVVVSTRRHEFRKLALATKNVGDSAKSQIARTAETG